MRNSLNFYWWVYLLKSHKDSLGKAWGQLCLQRRYHRLELGSTSGALTLGRLFHFDIDYVETMELTGSSQIV